MAGDGRLDPAVEVKVRMEIDAGILDHPFGPGGIVGDETGGYPHF